MCLNTAVKVWRGACITWNSSLERHHCFWFLYEKSGLLPFFWCHGHSGSFPQRPLLPLCGSSEVQVSHLCCSPGLTAQGTCSWQWHQWLSGEAGVCLRHSELILVWSKDLMPAQGVTWSLSLPNNPKVPCVPPLLCPMPARASSAAAAPVCALKESSQSSRAAPE